MPQVLLGNPAPIGAGLEPGCITEVDIPDSKTTDHAFLDITLDDETSIGVWAAHSRAKAPSWVESNDEELRERLAKHYGCQVGRPQIAATQE